MVQDVLGARGNESVSTRMEESSVMAAPSASNAVRQRKKRCGPGMILLLLVAIWLCFYLSGFLELVPGGYLLYVAGFVVVLAWLASRRALIACAIVLLLSPFSVFFFGGVTSYLIGRPTLLGVGLPGTTYHNIDRKYRCEWETLGDLVFGNEWLICKFNNVAVKLMVRIFGPASGSYIGPYPTKEQALRALAYATPVRLDCFLADHFAIGQREVRLDKGVGKGLLRCTGRKGYFHEGWFGHSPEEPGPIRCAIWQDRCLIVWIPSRYPYDEDGRWDRHRSARIAVVDLERGRPFAYYATGDYYHRWPPVAWVR